MPTSAVRHSTSTSGATPADRRRAIAPCGTTSHPVARPSAGMATSRITVVDAECWQYLLAVWNHTPPWSVVVGSEEGTSRRDRSQPAQGTDPERQRLACRPMATGGAGVRARGSGHPRWLRSDSTDAGGGDAAHRARRVDRHSAARNRAHDDDHHDHHDARPRSGVSPHGTSGAFRRGGCRCRYAVCADRRHQRWRCDLSCRGSPAPCRYDGRRDPWAAGRPQATQRQLPRWRARADRPRSRGHSNAWPCHQ